MEPSTAQIEWGVAPVLARNGQAETIVVQTHSGVVFALARSAPGSVTSGTATANIQLAGDMSLADGSTVQTSLNIRLHR